MLCSEGYSIADWKRLLDIMKDDAGNAWELRIPRASYQEREGRIS